VDDSSLEQINISFYRNGKEEEDLSALFADPRCRCHVSHRSGNPPAILRRAVVAWLPMSYIGQQAAHIAKGEYFLFRPEAAARNQ